MRDLTVLIKPASSLCNLRCGYCFYHAIADSREQASYGRMTTDTAAVLIEKALAAAPAVTFAFQGGEPTLAGMDFFRFFTDEVDRRNTRKAKVRYAIQTNGTAITEEFAGFLAGHGFLVGLSLDGPKDINDWMRVDASGKSVFASVVKTARLFDRMGVQYNVLCVVHSGVARQIEKVYRFFRKQGFEYLQFIPCLDPLDTVPFSGPSSLSPDLYADFLIRLFRLWAADIDAGRGVSIRFFDNLLSIAAGYPSEQCGMQGQCPGQFVIEGDGSVFPCDFYCVDNWRIGNIAELSFEQAYASPVMQKFIETSAYDDEDCRRCPYFQLCRGGCRRDRDAGLDGVAGDNRYCAALMRFYAEAVPRLPGLLQKLGVNSMHF
ncbi:MAG TPA: SPASM domain-containing protein [Clostridia bacterium]